MSSAAQIRLILCMILLSCNFIFCNESLKTSGEDRNSGQVIKLPLPRYSGSISLEEAIKSRRSVRSYSASQLTLEEISQLLWAAQGITDTTRGFRSVPSAGALYPLEVYVVLPDGVYHYQPGNHTITLVRTGDPREALSQAGLGQEAIRNSPAVFVVTGVYERTGAKYRERAERYVILETGHAAQNILLQASALGLAAVPIGAFHDKSVRTVLNCPADHKPLYLLPVGQPE